MDDVHIIIIVVLAGVAAVHQIITAFHPFFHVKKQLKKHNSALESPQGLFQKYC
jgi:hypothetical protein